MAENDGKNTASDLLNRKDRVYHDKFLDVDWKESDFKIESYDGLDVTIMPEEMVYQVWQQLGEEWGFGGEKQKRLKVGLISHCIINGSSQFGAGAYVRIDGKDYPMRDVITIISAFPNQTLRRFCSAQADFAHTLLRTNPRLAIAAAKKWDLPPEFASWAADFMLAHEEVAPNTPVRNALERSKAIRLSLSYHDDGSTGRPQSAPQAGSVRNTGSSSRID
jgi:hypothetical protein